MKRGQSDGIAWLVVLVLFAVVIAGLLGAWQFFKVWSAEQSGRAELAQAEYSRRVAVVEAQAKFDSSQLLADAEVRRAEGVAKANKIIGTSLQGNDGYLRYLWIQQLGANGQDVIYVPTEANLPILEARTK